MDQSLLTSALTLFFVMDPLGNIPVFNAVLRDLEPARRRRVIARELIFALAILLGFLIAGPWILTLLGLSQPSLNLAGGILLFIIALKMVFPQPHSAIEDTEGEPFIVPLAVPMVAGPSTLATLLLLSSSRPGQLTGSLLALLLAWLGTTAILVISPLALRFLGDRGLRALERLMGMLLILIAVQMFLNGLAQLPGSGPLVP